MIAHRRAPSYTPEQWAEIDRMDVDPMQVVGFRTSGCWWSGNP